MNPTIIPPPVDPGPNFQAPNYSPKIRSSASWLYWIAGLTVINSVMVLTHSQLTMILGLNIVLIVDIIGAKLGSVGVAVALFFTLAVAGGIFALGRAAAKGARWAFLVGIVFLGIDTIPLFIGGAQEILPIGIRVWAIASLVTGYKLARIQADFSQV